MNIVVLDGYTLNPGDLSWDELAKLGNLTVYDRTPKELIIERAQDAEVLFTNKTPLRANDFLKLPNLKFIGVLATGYDIVDVKAAAENNITVTNIPTYGTASVAQMAFALLLAMSNHVQQHSDIVRNGAWVESKDWCFWNYPLIELADKTFGIIGFGRIGQQTAQIAKAFGMHVIAYDVTTPGHISSDFQYVALDRLFSEADVISLHCPLTPETQGIINKENISKMKESAIIINTSRGKLIVEEDLANSLNEGRIAGACLDVLSSEPPMPSNPLLQAKNCLITPHISWATKEARARLMNIAIDNLKAFVQEKPINVVG